jgi:hypothetical protein
MQQLGGVCPPAVKVDPKYIAAVVSVDDPIGVEHGNDLENEALS